MNIGNGFPALSKSQSTTSTPPLTRATTRHSPPYRPCAKVPKTRSDQAFPNPATDQEHTDAQYPGESPSLKDSNSEG